MLYLMDNLFDGEKALEIRHEIKSLLNYELRIRGVRSLCLTPFFFSMTPFFRV